MGTSDVRRVLEVRLEYEAVPAKSLRPFPHLNGGSFIERISASTKNGKRKS